jgi:outer membrane protein OmpA-like peptidoglycan-associated protein
MQFNLMDAVKSQLTPSLIGRAGTAFGTSTETTQKLLSSALPAVVGGFSKFGTSNGGAGKLMSLLQHQPIPSDGEELVAPLDDVAEVSKRGEGVLGSIFGGKLEGTLGSVASSAGVGAAPAKGAMGLVATLGTGVLARHVRKEHLDARGLENLLGAPQTTAEVTRETYREPERIVDRGPPPKRRSPLLPIVFGAIALLAAWALLRGLQRPAPVAFQNPVYAPPEQAGERFGRNPPLGPRNVRPLTMPNETTVTSPPGSPPYQLSQALKPGAAGTLPERFGLSDWNFAPGSAQVPSAAEAEISGIGNVLKAHPTARIRIEGRTDSTGGPNVNERLSTDRAEAVKNALVSQGVNANQVDARGLPGGGGGETRGTDVVLMSR